MSPPVITPPAVPVMLHYVALAGCVLMTSSAQILLKIGAARKAHLGIEHSVFDVYAILGYAVFALNTVVAVYVMQGLELKTVSTVMALSYLCVLVLARFALREQLTRRNLLSCFLIIIGIVVFEF